MKKFIAFVAIALAVVACGDNGNPSGTPPPDSNHNAIAVPDTSHGNSTPDMGNTNKTTPNISDSATPSTPGRSGATTGDSSNQKNTGGSHNKKHK